MRQNAKKWSIVVAKHQAYTEIKNFLSINNVGEPISSYGIKWRSFSQNPCIDDAVFSNQTLYFRFRPHRQKVENAPTPDFRNLVVKLQRLSAIHVRQEFNSSHHVARHNLR